MVGPDEEAHRFAGGRGMSTLHVRAVFCGELREGVIGIVASEEESGEGHDTYCLSLHHGVSVYGGVTRWLLVPGRLDVELSKEASEALGVDAQLTIEFDAPLTDVLEEWLPRILGKN